MRFPSGKRVRSVGRWAVAICVLSGFVAPAIAVGCAQGVVPGRVIARRLVIAPPPVAAQVRILREIRDPHSGARWLVLSDPNRPGGPGRMTWAEDASGPADDSAPGTNVPVVVIHAGDRVVVEEHTATVEACLEATAVDAAAVGSQIDFRLKIGGKVVRAVAIAPGRAALVHRGAEQP